jgi:hypothetical protein
MDLDRLPDNVIENYVSNMETAELENHINNNHFNQRIRDIMNFELDNRYRATRNKRRTTTIRKIDRDNHKPPRDPDSNNEGTVGAGIKKKLVKGSKEATDRMAFLRSLRKK